MLHRRTFKILLCTFLLSVFALPVAIVSASSQADRNTVSHAQTSFIKYGPSNGYSFTGSSLTIVWGTSGGATLYQYCYDTSDNGSCDSSWYYNGTSTMATLNGLSTNTTYYWQVRASGPNGSVDANNGTWWSFTVVPPTPTPVPFGKSIPANGATGQDLTLLTAWTSSPGAVRYEYCYDTINNGACDGTWSPNGTTQWVYFNNLSYSTTYSWQVRAVDAGNNIVYANNGAWWSFTTRPAPTATPTPTPSPAFFKYGPANGSTVQTSTTTVTFAWGTSAGVTQYQYCYDTINNSACDTSWNSAGTNSTGTTGTLSDHTTYYWEVRAIGSSGAITYADAGTWWSFTTSFIIPPPTPVPFGKSTPANGATGQSTSPVLAWSAGSGATSYEYCLDTFNNGACDSSNGWTTRGTATYVFPSGLSSGTTYFWQVRALTASGYIYADSSAWWSFTTN